MNDQTVAMPKYPEKTECQKMSDLIFEPIAHTYTLAGKIMPSVTQIINAVIPRTFDPDPWYMQRGTMVHRAVALVAKSMGHGRLNELITTEMRKWFVSSAESVLRKMPDDQKLTGDMHLNTVKMYITLGRLADADTELLSRHQKQLALLGAKSIKVAETMCEMGTVKWKLGKLEVALSLLTEARLICGKSELENLDLLGNITNRVGAVLDDQGKYDDAMQSYTESLALKVRCFSTEHVKVAETDENMAIVYKQMGELKKALETYE